MMRRTILFFFVIFLNCGVTAQPETWKWYFGINAALDFSSTPPTALTGAMVSDEGCSSVADPYGNLLFYTNGENIWNKQHQVMANGSGLMGAKTSAQGALIVKKPGSATQYYVFTAFHSQGLRYSVVDMSLSAGLGSVTAVKNVLLHPLVTEQLSAVKHCNNTDIWIMVHEPGNANFFAYLITSSGINTIPVLSTPGPVYSNTVAAYTLKFSPNGRTLATALHDSIYLYGFNRSTGIVANAVRLCKGTAGYGIEFSPDATKFYAIGVGGSIRIWQWDLCAGNIQAVRASSVAVLTQTGSISYGMMQLAPDGKIYVARGNKIHLGVIHDPNVQGVGCNYIDTSQSLLPNHGDLGLPGFVTSDFLSPAPPFTYTLSCLSATFQAHSAYGNSSSCAASNFSVNGIQWVFDDPVTGAANVSTLTNPVHQFSKAGIFRVKLAYATDCGTDTIVKLIHVAAPPQISVTGSETLCAGQSASLNAAGQLNPLWYHSDTSSVHFAAGNTVTTPTLAPGTYTYFLAVPGCTLEQARMPFALQVHAVPSLTLTPLQPTVCVGEQIVLSAAGADIYSWHGAGTGSAVTLQPVADTVYSVTGLTQKGCSTTATVTVKVDVCTGVHEKPENPANHVYPNPATKGFVADAHHNGVLRVFDNTGRLLFAKTINQGKNQIGMEAFPKGIYHVQFEGQGPPVLLILE